MKYFHFLMKLLLFSKHTKHPLVEDDEWLLKKYARGDIYLERGLYMTKDDRKRLREKVAELKF